MKGLKGARILVTGAAGFLGQHVSGLLSSMGAETLPVSRRIGFDLTAEARALAAILVARPDIVVHLAAPPEIAPPASWVRDSLLMGLNVLDACAMARAKAVLVCRHGPQGSPQHAVRQALLAAARAHRRQDGLLSVQLVPCDLYGPLDHFESGRLRLVPDVLTCLLGAKAKKSKELVLEGNGKKPFPLLYVEDAAKAVAIACGLPGCDEPLEMSGPDVLSLDEISAEAAKCAGFEGRVSWDPQADPWRPAVQDGAVAREILGWEPETKVKTGLKATFEWLQETKKSNIPG